MIREIVHAMRLLPLGLASLLLATSATYALAGGNKRPHEPATAAKSTYQSHVKLVDAKARVTDIRTKGVQDERGTRLREVETKTDASGTQKTFRFGATGRGFRVERRVFKAPDGAHATETRTRLGEHGAVLLVTGTHGGIASPARYIVAPMKFPSTVAADLASVLPKRQPTSVEFVDRDANPRRVVLTGGLSAAAILERLTAAGL